MRSLDEVAAVLELHGRGESVAAIARITSILRATVRDWIAGRVPRAAYDARASCAVCNSAVHDLLALPPAYAYLLGLYLGDGCMSVHARGVYKLRIFLDLRYPGIIDQCEDAMAQVLRGIKTSRLSRRGSFAPERGYSHVEVYSYWRYPRYSFANKSDDIRAIFMRACDLVGIAYTQAPDTVYVSRRADVDRLDEFIGPKA